MIAGDLLLKWITQHHSHPSYYLACFGSDDNRQYHSYFLQQSTESIDVHTPQKEKFPLETIQHSPVLTFNNHPHIPHITRVNKCKKRKKISIFNLHFCKILFIILCC